MIVNAYPDRSCPLNENCVFQEKTEDNSQKPEDTLAIHDGRGGGGEDNKIKLGQEMCKFRKQIIQMLFVLPLFFTPFNALTWH